jgi:hypothetical protein
VDLRSGEAEHLGGDTELEHGDVVRDEGDDGVLLGSTGHVPMMAGILRPWSRKTLAVAAGPAQHERMFTDHCPRHGSRVLLGPRNITAIRNDADGIVVEWRCPCGGHGSLRTGRRRKARDL